MVQIFPIAALVLVSLWTSLGGPHAAQLRSGPSWGHGEPRRAVVDNEDAGTLAVTISGLRSDEGHVRLLLFAGAGGFPGEPARAARRSTLPIKGRSARVVFEGLPVGEYAISVIHDENDNEALDTGLFGIPSEGFGASNNPKVRRGPPRFAEASFRVEPDAIAVQMIRLRYF
jgi:uncharacterized protein (DUF2141 family)